MKRGSYSAKRKGQMKLSFGMIFSIILIAVFLGFGIYVIIKFVDTSDTAKLYTFRDNLQEDINRLERSDHARDTETYISLPSGVEEVCFADFSSGARGVKSSYYEDLEFYSRGGENNLVIYPEGEFEDANSFYMEDLDIAKITEDENPYCFVKNDGEISVVLSKTSGENLVTLER